jgi:precorrin-3B synthase
MTNPKAAIINGPIVQGWCPGALRPMESGDGWVVRLRPYGGRLTPVQVKGIADLSQRYGNGLIDLSSRANLQLRGVTPDTHTALITGLRALGLIDKNAQMESQRNVILAPFWGPTDGALALSNAVAAALTSLPFLPSKFGAGVDLGTRPVLRDVSCDIRIERAQGGFLVYGDGAARGVIVARAQVGDTVRALAEWFIAADGINNGRGRMRALTALPPDQFVTDVVPPAPVFTPQPMVVDQGALVGLAFGQIEAATLAKLGALWPLRMTPWRMILLEGARAMPQIAGLLASDDPLLRSHACVGAPACKQALGQTRDLARKLAPLTKSTMHISGCAKGCAHPSAAPLTITATPNGYDIATDATASGAAVQSGLTPDGLAQWIKTNAT